MAELQRRIGYSLAYWPTRISFMSLNCIQLNANTDAVLQDMVLL